MAKPKAGADAQSEQVAKQVTETVEADAQSEQVAEAKADKPAKGQVRVRVVRPVEGKKVGEEFNCFPHEFKLQIKHKSIEIVG